MFPTRIIPVIVIDDPQTAQPLGELLVEHNLPIAEITLRTPAALESIKIMAQIPGLTVGAGTALTEDQAKAAHNAGSQFIVSPALHKSVIHYCQNHNLPVIPGIATPSEIAQAIDLDLNTLKFFPAEALGGAKALKAITSVYPEIKIMPTGGITPQNIQDYLNIPNVIACGGSYITPRQDLKNKNWSKIATLIKTAASI